MLVAQLAHLLCLGYLFATNSCESLSKLWDLRSCARSEENWYSATQSSCLETSRRAEIGTQFSQAFTSTYKTRQPQVSTSGDVFSPPSALSCLLTLQLYSPYNLMHTKLHDTVSNGLILPVSVLVVEDSSTNKLQFFCYV